MPNYDFICTKCKHKFAKRVAIKDKDEVVCPECGGEVRQSFMGAQTGIITGAKETCTCKARPGG